MRTFDQTISAYGRGLGASLRRGVRITKHGEKLSVKPNDLDAVIAAILDPLAAAIHVGYDEGTAEGGSLIDTLDALANAEKVANAAQ